MSDSYMLLGVDNFKTYVFFIKQGWQSFLILHLGFDYTLEDGNLGVW